MDSILAEEIVGLWAQLQNRQKFNKEIGKIDKFTCQTMKKYEMKKERKKIECLLMEKIEKNAEVERNTINN